MSFKNNRGDVSWYVVALVLAVVVLIVSLFVVPKILNAQNQSGRPLTDNCSLVGGACQAGTSCATGTPIPGACPKGPTGNAQVCCKQ